MSFKCPKMEEMARNRAAIQIIDNIANELKQDYQCACEYVPPTPQKQPRCTCEGCECPCAPPKPFIQPEIYEPPPVMVCYKVPKPKSLKTKQIVKANNENKTKNMSNTHEEVVHRLTQSKSRELRCGVMYIGCDCEKRNGLQDDCQRTECHGSPACLTKPYPICGPSEFANAKHLEKIWGPRAAALQHARDQALLAGRGGVNNTSSDNGFDANEPDYEYHCFPASIKTAENEIKCCSCV